MFGNGNLSLINKEDIILKNGSAIFINKKNIQNNYLFLQKVSSPSRLSAVLKSNAYGLGLKEMVSILTQVNCEDIFVATLDEAIIARKNSKDINIYVLHGIFKGEEKLYSEYNLIPVINSYSQLQKWQNYATKIKKLLPCIIHIDTGMNRLGFLKEDLNYLLKTKFNISYNLNILYVMSHLACSSISDSKFNKIQLNNFKSLVNKYFKGYKYSLAASYGLFLDSAYIFDLVRVGFALYGSNPTPNKPNPLLPVIEYYSSVLKVNKVKKGEGIGYNHMWIAKKDSVIATVSVGYSDGILLNKKKDFCVFINNEKAPLVGRVSMDSILVDVTNVKTNVCEETIVEIIGNNQDIDSFTKSNNTINCEALTVLGSVRYPKVYY